MRRLRGSRGSLLIICLWMVALLSVTAVAIGRGLSREVQLMKYRKMRIEMASLARAGVYLIMSLLEEDETPDYDWLGEEWARLQPAEVYPERVLVIGGMADVGGRINLNTASLEALANLTGSADVARGVTDYVDPPAVEEIDTGLQPAYFPKDGPMVTLEELREIPAVASDPESAAIFWVTGAARSPDAEQQLNINTVNADVMIALAGEDSYGASWTPVVQDIVAARPGTNGQFGDDDDCYASDPQQIAVQLAACNTMLDDLEIASFLTTGAYGVRSDTYHVRVQARTPDASVVYNAEATLQRSPEDKTVTILTWKEY